MGKEGTLRLNVFNTTNEVMCIPARAGGIRFFGVEELEVQKLPNELELTEANCVNRVVKKMLSGNSGEQLREELASSFPEVFDLTSHPITPAMKALMVKESELPPWKAPLVGGAQTVYAVDKMVKHEDIIRTLEHYERMGYIERVRLNSPVFLSPLMPFTKPKDPSAIRVVNDFRKLNGYFPTTGRTQIDVRRVIDRIPQEWKFFSVLDLKEGFFSVPIEPTLRSLFGFHYDSQRWVYKRLPQGFSFSPILFSERVAHVIEGTGALNFADDLIVGGATQEEHNARLHHVMRRLRHYGMKLNPSKMKLLLTTVTYLRYTLKDGTWSLLPYLKEKTEQLGRVASRPTLEKHIGILSFARTHVPKVEMILRPLRNWLKIVKSRTLNALDWKKVTQSVNEAYEHCLKTHSILSLPNRTFSKYLLYTDWADYHMGYMLFGYDGAAQNHCLLDIGSHVMPKASSSFLGELKGIVAALERTRSIRGTTVPTTVFSDNQAVVNKLRTGTMVETDARVCRCWEYLLHNEPLVTYEYLPGSDNSGADLLSRLNNRKGARVNAINAEVEDKPPPEELQRRLHQAHFGHWGAEVTMMNAVMEFGAWRGMKADVLDFVDRCQNCAFSGHPQIRDGPTKEFVTEFSRRIHIDFAGPYFDGSHICVLVDGATRFMQATRFKAPSTASAMKALENWIRRCGPMQELCCDAGSAFRSAQFHEWCRAHEINVRMSPTNYHEGNAIVERAIQTLLHRLRRMLNGSDRDWPEVIPAAVYALNTSWHSAIGTCPQALAFGKDRDGTLLSETELAERWRAALEKAAKLKEKQAERFSWKHPRLSAPLKVGMKVLVKDHNFLSKRLKKLSVTWKGPFHVVRQASRSIWVLSKDPEASPWFLAHSSQMKPFTQ